MVLFQCCFSRYHSKQNMDPCGRVIPAAVKPSEKNRHVQWKPVVFALFPEAVHFIRLFSGTMP
jgi:hypothetical protein